MSNYLGFEPTEKENSYFFISYNNEDAERIGKILSVIREKYDIPFWYDYGIPYNSFWAEVIADRIKNSNGILMFLTNGVFNKGKKSYVYKEYKMAEELKKRISIVLVDDINSYEVPSSLLSWKIDIDDRQNIFAQNKDYKTLAIEIVKSLNHLLKQDEPRLIINGKKMESISRFDREKANLLMDRKSYDELLDYCMNYNSDPASQVIVGFCYENGYGVEQNYQKAIEWYIRAADQRYAEAQNMLGNCYYYGHGVEQDYNKMVIWYEKAAKQSYAVAQKNLGDCYMEGLGVLRNYNKAVEWYKKAADQGNKKAKKILDSITIEMHEKALEDGLNDLFNEIMNRNPIDKSHKNE